MSARHPSFTRHALLGCVLATAAACHGAPPPSRECTVVHASAGEPARELLVSLAARHGSPLLIGDGKVWRCPCGSERRLGGGTQQRDLAGGTEDRDLAGDTQDRELAGATQNRELRGATQDRRLAGQTEDRDLGGDTQDRELAGATQQRELRGATQDRQLAGATEDRDLDGDTQDRDLAGGTQNRELRGATQDRAASGRTEEARVTCVPDVQCGGFRVAGLGSSLRAYSNGSSRTVGADCVPPY